MTSTTRAARTTRVSKTRLLILLVVVGALGWFGFRAVSAAATGPVVPGPSTFSAYVDVTATPASTFETPTGAAQSQVTLSFIVSDPSDACTPSWGGYYSLDEANEALDLDRRIVQLESVGGHARVSFGGQANSSLAVGCTDDEALLGAYRDVVERYDLDTIDLDVEGAALDDTASIDRRATAIASLQAERADDSPLAVWLTLPVDENGLTDAGEDVVRRTLAAGVDLAGVNGMTMNFGADTATTAQSELVESAAVALQAQVDSLYAAAGTSLGEAAAWGRVGLTVMVGQNDVSSERFTLDDATAVNQFALDHGVGLVAMWSLNRDATCTSPLPTVTTVVQTSCSGIDQEGVSFADTLAKDLPSAAALADSSAEPSIQSSSEASADAGSQTDDPATSPYPIWDALGVYPAGTKIVWHRQVYEARYWTTGVAPGSAGADGEDPWTLVGPVLPGETPAPLPTVPAGTYPDWDEDEAYSSGDRVQVDGVPYEAKWWSQGTEPGVTVEGGSPWVLVIPAE
ncbi:chitinase [Demequina sp. NBRC 110057]|uniref:chitinase n=1 Tax=Demequina sp. NBRC 110057 TaxID=1570346 RepID=UPI0013562FE3|nr:carbohydrate-binding protein [Demequina sp. NBRC 110057]